MKTATGTVRYKDGILTIKTNAKRGKKIVPIVVNYTVTDLRPDPKVANPAYRLTKDDGEFYDVHLDEWGPACSCPHATFRGANNRVPCKHCLAMMACGLLPK